MTVRLGLNSYCLSGLTSDATGWHHMFSGKFWKFHWWWAWGGVFVHCSLCHLSTVLYCDISEMCCRLLAGRGELFLMKELIKKYTTIWPVKKVHYYEFIIKESVRLPWHWLNSPEWKEKIKSILKVIFFQILKSKIHNFWENIFFYNSSTRVSGALVNISLKKNMFHTSNDFLF